MPEFTVNTDVDVDFEVFCGRCGAGLCNQSTTRSSVRRRLPQIEIEPCSTCEEQAIWNARKLWEAEDEK